MDGSNESAEHETLMRLLKLFELQNPNCYGNVDITDGIITRVFFGLPHAQAVVSIGGPVAVEARFGPTTRGGVFVATVPSPRGDPLPIAIAFAQQETDDNWRWVWQNLARFVPHVIKIRRLAKPLVYPVLAEEFSEGGINGVCLVYLSQDMLKQKAMAVDDLPQFKRAVTTKDEASLKDEVARLPESAQLYLAQYPPSTYGGHGDEWNNISGSSKYITTILGDADYIPWVKVTNNMLEDLQRHAHRLV